MAQPVIGRVIGKRLTDELGDRVALIMDGVDGRTHHVALGDKAVAQDAPMGPSSRSAARPSDPARRIEHRRHGGGHRRLSPSEHRAMAKAGVSACPAAI